MQPNASGATSLNMLETIRVISEGTRTRKVAVRMVIQWRSLQKLGESFLEMAAHPAVVLVDVSATVPVHHRPSSCPSHIR